MMESSSPGCLIVVNILLSKVICMKTMRLDNDEIDRLRDKDLKNLLRQRKLCLVLDLDHTLLNSALISDITEEEGYLNCQTDALPGFSFAFFYGPWFENFFVSQLYALFR